VVQEQLEADFQKQMDGLKAEYEAKLEDLRVKYPAVIARRMADTLLKASQDNLSLADILAQAKSMPAVQGPAEGAGAPGAARPVKAVTTAPNPGAATLTAPTASTASTALVEEEAGLAIEAYIDSERCTSCDECTNLNKRMFAYNAKKQAYIKDAKAGTFKDLVTAAERCPAQIIHPGTPLNPKEKDLDKWVKRAERFK
jgi:pyruvate-ferredoxin/flavodoxin oxidoreductase